MMKRSVLRSFPGLPGSAAIAFCLFALTAPASAEHVVWTCQKLPNETEFATLTFDPTLLGIDSDVDDGGKHYEIEYTVRATVRHYDDDRPDWEGPKVCEFRKSWNRELRMGEFYREFHEYPIDRHFTIENVPRHSVVKLRFWAIEDDDFTDDWVDFNASPLGDSEVTIDAFINQWKFRTMIGERQNQFDITLGQTKRLTGDGKTGWSSSDSFRAMMEFILNAKIQESAGGVSPGLPSPGQPVTPPPPHPDDRPVCRDYAMKSVEQNQEAQSLGCGFQPPVWSSDHQMHFDWCVHGNNEQSVAGHIQSRETELQACRQAKAPTLPPQPPQPPPGADPTVAMCELYANEAIKIAAKASALNCPGLIGGRWLQDYKAHYDWCIANPNPVVLLAEATARDAAYKACGGN